MSTNSWHGFQPGDRVFRGSVYVRPKRCRSCRQRERARRAEARRVHLAGLVAERPPA